MITLLVAGHETTSGLLSFTFYHLLTHPAAYAEAQKEVDALVGGGPITADHLASLPYLNAVFRESLRLTPPIPTIMLTNNEDTVLGGRHYIKASTPIIALIAAVHRDPSVYGSDADEFRPERMLDGEFARRNKQYPDCWKPFGNGVRACIGRSLAWQQALLAVTMILQNFELSMDSPSYQLKIKQTLTVKPEGFHMRARLRRHGTSATIRTLASRPAAPSVPDPVPDPGPAMARQAAGTPMNIYYGSNTGTCKQLAHQLAGHAAEHGFRADVVDTLNSAADGLPADRPTVVVAASYNGQPADNAARFVAWARSLKGTELASVAYAVYGCGNRDWTDTFHKIPRELDSVLEQRGGTRLVAMGTCDVARGCVASDLETWADNVFWPAMRERYSVGREPEGGLCDETANARGDVKEKRLGDAEKKELGGKELKEESALQVTISSPRSSALGRDLSSARVRKSIVLPGAGSTSKRHIEVELPQGMTYAAGDYVDILPCNPKDVVCRALRKFGIAGDSVMTLYSGRPTPLPTNTPIAATEAFGAYVELTQPATQRAAQALQDATRDQATKTKLARLAEEAYEEEIAIGRLSVLDLLERFPTVRISPGAFLSMHSRMRTRPYCVSSSPLWNDRVVTLTYSVASQPAAGGQKHPAGVGSTYLDSLLVGDELSVRVRKSPLEASRLPEDVENVRLVMIAAGTGRAPSTSTRQAPHPPSGCANS
jgi:cytochrome P450/NADPH-cytochrome P450 reductase